jgi:3-oxoadipate enol-lactonase
MEHRAHNGDVALSYDVDGPPDAPAVLLINSIAATRELWARQMPALAARYRVIRYDARGHGRSSAPPGDYTLDQLGRDAVAILEDARAATAHVCGISLGGLTAQWLGVHAPGHVASLVLANTGARIGTAESWGERIALVREKGMTVVADMTIPRWFSEEFQERDPETVRGFRTMIQACPADGYLGCCAALRDADLRDRIKSIGCPTLVIASTADAATPADGLAFIRDRVPGARMVTVASRHLSNIECAEEFTAAVQDFLEPLGSGVTNRAPRRSIEPLGAP